MFRNLAFAALVLALLAYLLASVANLAIVATLLPLGMVLLAEQRLSLGKLARQEGLNPTTVWRWSTRGVRGVKLETMNIGARRFTTQEAYERFVERSTAVANGTPIPQRTAKQKESAIDRAEAELEKELAS
ncbi:DUF1580 domain-containing protein [Aeoliella sp. ICT_H6.2]|uniref:DUF1580 domain-containing protein n=1 Tax=Aeoliella straminimaris TaxID=2954799 RepID=A0A9X2F7X4_9BACT|nr:DUF1580 domain-containing protein [Aeoliella straminimaris]MCO6043323.1 DUF1580 domain-containing protein [Aeoliella straminimaris]